jgi:hypothetical protein
LLKIVKCRVRASTHSSSSAVGGMAAGAGVLATSIRSAPQARRSQRRMPNPGT